MTFQKLWLGVSERKLSTLLRLEKARRGLDPNRLCFIGMANTANYWWCAQKSLFENRQTEKAFFGAYLQDRINSALEAGIITKPPTENEQLLTIAAKASFRERQRQFNRERQRKRPVARRWVTDDSGRAHLVDRKFRRQYLAGRIEISAGYGPDFGEDELDRRQQAIARGELDEDVLGEKYPTFRWHFRWGRFIVVGVPDGITDRFVYEFKSTKVLHYIRPVAERQADLYGYFFGRNRKRVQLYDVRARKLHTLSERVDRRRAQQTLRDFAATEAGRIPIPPKPWKCQRCEFLDECRVSPLRHSDRSRRADVPSLAR